MAYNEFLVERVKNLINTTKKVELKKMMGGLTFMVDDKMCLGVVNDDLMARIGPDNYQNALKSPGCRKMDFTGREMKGYVFIDSHGTDLDEDLEKWIRMALEFNKIAKSSKKR